MADHEPRVYAVLVNDEEQYSIWPVSTDVPGGWRSVKSGSLEECVAHVDAVWTDMRPLSLRARMDRERQGEAR